MFSYYATESDVMESTSKLDVIEKHLIDQNDFINRKTRKPFGSFYHAKSLYKLDELRGEIAKLYEIPHEDKNSRKVLLELDRFTLKLKECEDIILKHPSTGKYFQSHENYLEDY